jgi:hypothetical protein
MTAISINITGGPGIFSSTCPAATLSGDDVHMRSGTADSPAPRIPSDFRTPDDAFSGSFRFKPLRLGATAGRGGASGAALPNLPQPAAIPAGAGV